jgi:Tfp pilus assembly protein PilN
VVAVHAAGGRWALVAVSPDGPALVEALSGEGDGSDVVSSAVERHRVERVLRVAPARETIVKGVQVSVGDPREMEGALALMAEAQLPETLPPFRKGYGPVPDTGREGGRLALLTAWRAPVPEGESPEVTFETHWTTEATALAFLRGPDPGIAARADAGTGQITLVGAGPRGVVVRSLFERAEDVTVFRERARSLAAEAAAAVGCPEPVATPGGLMLPASRASRALVAGAPTDADWLDRHGLALGAALAAMNAEPAARSLVELRERAQVQRRTALSVVVETLSDTRRAAVVLAAAIGLLLFGPWALAGLRLAVLGVKSEGLSERIRELDLAGKREAMYRQAETLRWPMTKLLADFSRAAPVGITVEALSISPDQGLSVQGRADSQETLNTLLETLNATRVFTNTRINRQESAVSGVEFQLTAAVSNPHGRSSAGEDFASRPLAVRLYGEGASNTTTPVALDRPPPTNGGASRAISASPRPARERAEPAPVPNPSIGGASAGDAVPPPLTDEQIAAMDRRAAMTEMVRRRTYPQRNRDLEASVRSRLEDEVRRIQDHIQRLNRQPGGGGSP